MVNVVRIPTINNIANLVPVQLLNLTFKGSCRSARATTQPSSSSLSSRSQEWPPKISHKPARLVMAVIQGTNKFSTSLLQIKPQSPWPSMQWPNSSLQTRSNSEALRKLKTLALIPKWPISPTSYTTSTWRPIRQLLYRLHRAWFPYREEVKA